MQYIVFLLCILYRPTIRIENQLGKVAGEAILSI